MSKFDELLNRSLVGLNEGYDNAKQGLESVVGEVTESLLKIVGTKYQIKLTSRYSCTDYTVFQYHGVRRFGREHTIFAEFKIDLDGYPIAIGAFDDDEKSFIAETYAESKEGLEDYFSRLMSDKNSALLLFVAFAQRSSNE